MAFDAPSVDISTLPKTETGIVDLCPEWINVDAGRFQFKQGGDAFGVTERLDGVTHFDATKCGIVLVWQDIDGKLFLADGHQRMGLAQRALAAGQNPDDIRLPARIYQAPEYSAEDVMVIAAYKNIAEGTGTSMDAARVMRKYGAVPDDLPKRGDLVRDAIGLAALSDEVFDQIYANPNFDPLMGAAIGRVLSDLKNMPADERLQHEKASMQALIRFQPAKRHQAEYIVREVLRTGISEEQSQMPMLFEMEEVNDYLEERVELVTAARKMLRSEGRATGFIVKNAKRIEGYVDGELDRRAAKSDRDDLLLMEFFLENGWKYSDLNGPVTTVAKKYADFKSGLEENNDQVRKVVNSFDSKLSETSKVLKAAKQTGDSREITQARAACVEELIGHLQAFVRESDIAGTLRRSLGSEAQGQGTSR